MCAFLVYLLFNRVPYNNISTDTQIIAQVKVIARKADVGSGILVEILDKDQTYSAVLEVVRQRFFGGNTALTLLPSTYLSHPVDTTASACSSGLLDMYVSLWCRVSHDLKIALHVLAILFVFRIHIRIMFIVSFIFFAFFAFFFTLFRF